MASRRKRKRASLGRARGFGAPLWWMEPPYAVVQAICVQALAAYPRMRIDPSAMQARLRKAAALSSRMLRDAHIYVEGAGW